MSENLDILIPHYCDPKGLSLSLESVANQTWQGEMRVVVVDDGSPGEQFVEVERICEDFRKLGLGDILLERNTSNQGRPITRNRLLSLTNASYVAWLDAGDIWYPKKLEYQFEHLLRLRARGINVDKVWISCSYHWKEASKEKPRRVQQECKGDQYKNLIVGTHLRAYLWTLLGTSDSFRIAGRFDENLPRLQDLDYFLNFVRGGGRIEVPPNEEALCQYYKTDVGRDADQVYNAYTLILRKNRPCLQRYSPDLRSMLTYKANRLSSRFAASNKNYYKSARYITQAAVQAPRHSLKVLFKTLSKRIKA